MLTPHANFIAAIAEGKVKVAELYVVELSNGVTYRYTSHNEDIVWDVGANTYTAIPVQRSSISAKIDLEADAVEIGLANITGDLYDVVQKNVLDSAKVTIKRILWNETFAAGMEIIVFIGRADIEFDRQILVLRCKSILNSLNFRVPRLLYQEPCNNRLFDINCSLTRANYDYAGAATGGSTTTLIDTTCGIVYKVNFDAGDSSNPIEIGDTATGQTGAGTGVVVQIIYLTSTTGTLWYVEQSGVQFVDDEELQNVGGDSVDVNGTPAEDTTFYGLGELEMTGGDNNGCRRPILSSSVNTRTVMWPFPNTVANGDTYNIYPGCDKRAIVCEARFHNEDNFNGFLYMPKVEETVL